MADWPKEYRYYAALQQALQERRIPYFLSRPIQETRKLLGLPELTWSPQLVLLSRLSIARLVAVNTVLLYTAGFGGLLLLRRRLRLSAGPFALLFLLFAFNGHITAHLAIGHSMWVGYFLLPFFFWTLVELTEHGASPTWPVRVALVLFLVLLQGSFHVFVWCVMFLLLLGASHPRRLRAVAPALAWTVALTACRIVPAAIALEGRREQDFLSGYPSASVLVSGLVQIVPLSHPREGGRFGRLDWWEYDAYLGWAGLVWLLGFGLLARLRQGRDRPHRDLDLPAALMALLSLGNLFYPINALGVPLLGSQRVSSRLLVLPLGLWLTLAALHTQQHLDRTRWRRLFQAALAATALATALGFVLHMHVWSVPAVEVAWPPLPHPRDLTMGLLPIEQAVQTPRDAWYVAGVRVSAALSTIGLLAALAQLVRHRRRAGGAGGALAQAAE